MEIKLPQQLITPNLQTNKLDSLSLQLNQQLDAKVLNNKLGQNAIALQIGDKSIEVKSNLPLDVKNDQKLTLQLIKLQPLLEFKLVEKPGQSAQSERFSALSDLAQLKSTEVILKQIQPETTKSFVEAQNSILKNLTQGQPVTLKLVSVSAKELTGIVLPEPARPNNRPPQTVTIALNQLSNFPSPKTGANTLEALPIKPEQLLTLESIKNSNPPQFKIIPNTTPAAIEHLINETVKRHLPHQESPLPLLRQLSSILSTESQNINIPETLKRLAREILQNLPQRTQLSQPESLKQLIDNSGRFLEAKLPQLIDNPALSLQDDFKLKLLKLVTLLQQTEPKTDQKTQQNEMTSSLLKELLQRSNGALARIVLDQLNSLPKEEGLKQTWILELPFLNQQQMEQVTIEVEQDRQGEKQQQKKTWSVNIIVTPPKLGTIHCKIISVDQVVSTRFWSEQHSTVAKINHHLEHLKQQLENNGLKPGIIEVQQGKPNPTSQESFPGRNLLNEEV